MNLMLDLQIACDEKTPSQADFENWVATAIAAMDEAEITIRLVDKNEITELNDQYRHQNKATNVLSFPAELPDHIDLPLLGDLVICAAVVIEEAAQQQKNTADHWAHMVIHGTLHLLGYDHVDDDEAEIMEALEIKLLAKLGIDNPYLPLTI